jgi:hypothetical protein
MGVHWIIDGASNTGSRCVDLAPEAVRVREAKTKPEAEGVAGVDAEHETERIGRDILDEFGVTVVIRGGAVANGGERVEPIHLGLLRSGRDRDACHLTCHHTSNP